MKHMTVLLTVGQQDKVNKCTPEETYFMKHFAMLTEVARTAVVCRLRQQS